MKKVLIQYFRDGWRYGYAIEIGRKWTRIRPIPPYKVPPPKRAIRILTADTKPVKEN